MEDEVGLGVALGLAVLGVVVPGDADSPGGAQSCFGSKKPTCMAWATLYALSISCRYVLLAPTVMGVARPALTSAWLTFNPSSSRVTRARARS
ncbi:hypothetical protein D9R06_05395 [Kocuria marina subsp. indica]|nr:hypothetical protein D9R06_05395 [Kocuria indica]